MGNFKRNIVITGGAGFIGSHVVRLFANKYPDYRIIIFDSMTYAGNVLNIEDSLKLDNVTLINVDIATEFDIIKRLIIDYNIDGIIHLAAESHVDRSIKDPFVFARTNVLGTLNLLQACKEVWGENYDGKMFYHISTDEVYGALDMNPENKFKETTKYNPHSPYSASKASSDHFVRAFHDTYGMPTVISNCSNNYGPNQFPEKLIPLAINNLKNGRKIPIYGKGENIRDWLYVEDHAKAIDLIFHRGVAGETYNIGGNNEMKNIDIIRKIIEVYEQETVGSYCWKLEDFVVYVPDRKGHDLRYAIDSSKLQRELGWEPEETFDTGIRKTVKWYIENSEWMDKTANGSYQEYYNNFYKH